MLTSSIVDLYELQWLGVSDAAVAQGADLVCFVGEELEHPEGFRAQANAVYELAGAERFDGLIVWTTTLELFVGPERMERYCRQLGPLPIVSVERILAASTSVLMDERQGMDDAVSHLIEAHGRERIAFIRGPANHTGAQNRFQGYRDALARHGLTFDPALAPAVDSWASDEAGEAAMNVLSGGSDRVEAFATANDDLALGVLGALDALDLRAPQDIAVVGFDDHVNFVHHAAGIEIMRAEAPRAVLERSVSISAAALPLTTVRAPFYELGRRAVELLLAQLEGDDVPEVVAVPTELVVRRSCGCFSPAVRNAAQESIEPGRVSHGVTALDWERVAAEMRRALARSDASLPPSWPERLVAAYVEEVEGGSAEAFLDVLDELARASIRAGDTLESWWRALSALRRQTAGSLTNTDAALRAEDFWLRVQALLGELADRLSEYERIVIARRDRIVRTVGRRLIAAPDAEEIAAALSEELPTLGIPGCYLARYSPEPSSDEGLVPDDSRLWARSLLVQHGDEREQLEPGEATFSSKQLAPVERLGSSSPASLVALPLYFKEQQLGFVLFEVGPRLGWVYEELREQLSSALHAALLVERERRALAAVEQAHDDLEDRVAMRTAELEHANQVLTEQIIERELAEAKQARLEAQLLQAQKMEAIGRLAGGIAHDFNNMLVVINGFSELLLRRTEPDDPAVQDLEQIRQAGERAADLTRRLLAFSRQQVIQPSVVDLNEIVSNVEPMLRRLIGEDVELATDLAPSVSTITADAGQIEQIILNLALNARDAMPDGGRLTIATTNVDLDPDYAREHLGAEPGPHVHLRVRDTGVGMDAETRARLFEPFFTTKPAGRGTGLGLATVFGIVQQSGGHISVSSAPGQGSTFDIYLPQSGRPALAIAESEHAPSSLGGSETILLVEDEPGVRLAARRFLEEHGYRVLDAGDGAEALRLCELHDGSVDLVITDVVMPGMSGRELVERMARIRPHTPVLYVSGYVDTTRAPSALQEAPVPLLQKPFSADVLAEKVRETLDARTKGG